MSARRTGPNVSLPRSVTRRRFVGVATGAVAAPALVVNAVAQEELNVTPEHGTPVGSPIAPSEIDTDTLYTLSQQLAGDGKLAEEAVEPLATLIGADQQLVSGFEELVTYDDPTSDDAREQMSDDASATMKNILLYWYDGSFGDQPVENRADILFGLPVWGTVPYVTQPTLCKGFGYWANDISIDDEATPEAGS